MSATQQSGTVVFILTVNRPNANTPQRTNFLLIEKLDRRNKGIGIIMIIISEDILKTALVIRWFVAVAH